MMRHCDGTDPSLIRRHLVYEGDFLNIVKSVSPEWRPCDCGLEFDDIQRSVIWPHPIILRLAEDGWTMLGTTTEGGTVWIKPLPAPLSYRMSVVDPEDGEMPHGDAPT